MVPPPRPVGTMTSPEMTVDGTCCSPNGHELRVCSSVAVKLLLSGCALPHPEPNLWLPATGDLASWLVPLELRTLFQQTPFGENRSHNNHLA